MSRLTKKQREDQLVLDTKAKLALENTLSKQEMNKIEKCTSAKKLCEGVIAMHEGTSKAKLARRDFL